MTPTILKANKLHQHANNAKLALTKILFRVALKQSATNELTTINVSTMMIVESFKYSNGLWPQNLNTVFESSNVIKQK